MTILRFTHIATSDDYALSPVISADGRYLAMNAHLATYFLDASVQGKEGPVVLDLDTGIARLVTAQAPHIAISPYVVVAGIDRDGSTVLLQGGWYDEAILTGQIARPATYLAESDSTKIVPIASYASGMVRLTAKAAALSSDGTHLVLNGSQWSEAGVKTANGVFEVDLRSGAIVPIDVSTEALDMEPYLTSALEVSADGGKVLFDTYVTDRATGTSRTDLMVYDAASRTTTSVYTTTGGTAADGYLAAHAISDNGRYAVFGSMATNLVPDLPEGTLSGVYLKDLATGSIRLVSADAAGKAALSAGLDSAHAVVATSCSRR